MADQIRRILHAVGNRIFALTSPRAAMMRDQHHASRAAERLPDSVEPSETGEPVKHQHTGSFVPERPIRFQDLAVDLRAAAFENQRVVIGNIFRGAGRLVA